ncbi:MAG TPA: hypothetical protein VEN29_01475 [Casimicrobiaceae bacterium]|nr:hypothetical protein [Casimicrobiaceae bacterium]
MSLLKTRLAISLGALLMLAACATGPAGPPVAAPVLAMGDHWLYRITDNLRMGLVTMLDVEVVTVSGGTATLRLTYNNLYGRSEGIEEIDANGGLVVGALKEDPARRFPKPIEMYRFPLERGETWRQVVDTISPETQLPAQILVYGTVLGQAAVTVPGGAFSSTYVYRILQLDDEQFWRTRTTRNDSVWFSPDVKAPVRELRDASYIWRSGPESSVVRTENTTRELISYQPGGK